MKFTTEVNAYEYELKMIQFAMREWPLLENCMRTFCVS